MADRRVEIAGIAAQVIADHGIEGASLREIAARMDATIGTLTHHFRDRDDLLRTAFEVSVRDARERAERAARDRTGVPLLAALLAEALPMDERRRVEAAVWLAFSVSATTNERHAALCAALYREYEDAIADALAGTGAPPDVARDRARLLIATTDGIALRAITMPAMGPADQERLLGMAIADAMGAA